MERVSKKMGKFLHSNHVMGTENMEILKVVIADDEVRICQLIQALIDWDSMGMKVVGIAHNGEEACEMVRQTQPDQNRPVITPFSSTSIFSAAGTLGRPGMVMMSPVCTTMKPAPAEIFTLVTLMVKPSGRPSFV